MRIKNLPSISSMDGSQDALIIEQTDGSEDKSRKVSPAQIKQYVLGNSIDDIYSVMGQNGAKNLIPYPYTSNSYSQKGIDFTCLSDGTINANGTNDGTGNSTYFFVNFTLSKGTYVLNGCPTQTGSNYRCGVARASDSGTIASEQGSGAKFTLDADIQVRFYVQVFSGKTADNITFKPMLRFATDTDDTYQPYAMTNKQLTEQVADVKGTIGDITQTGVTGDTVAAQLGTAKGQIANKIKKLPTQTTRYNFTAANTYQYTGVNVTCPAGHTYIVRVWLVYSNSEPKGIVASSRSDTMRMYECYAREELATSITFVLMGGESAYIWGKGTTTNGDDVKLDIIDITN